MGILWQRNGRNLARAGGVPKALMAGLDWLPLPCLLLNPEGCAIHANAAWGRWSSIAPDAANGTGWLGVVDASQRDELRIVLRAAAADATAGSADCWLDAASQPRLARWWWRPGPAGRLMACVAELDGRIQDEHSPNMRALDVVMSRVIGISEDVQSIISWTDEYTAARLEDVTDALDELVGELDTAVLRSRREPQSRSQRNFRIEG